jgi:hypothetical protein
VAVTLAGAVSPGTVVVVEVDDVELVDGVVVEGLGEAAAAAVGSASVAMPAAAAAPVTSIPRRDQFVDDTSTPLCTRVAMTSSWPAGIGRPAAMASTTTAARPES